MDLAQEIASAVARNEAQLAKSIAAPTVSLDADAQDRLRCFVDWCKERGVRPLPAAPATVAAFIKSLAHWATNDIVDLLINIEELHSNNNLANPAATTVVRAVLQDILKLEPPHWNKSEQLLWAALPPEVQAVISRRDKQTSTLIRRLQNHNAELKKLSNKGHSDGTSDPKTA